MQFAQSFPSMESPRPPVFGLPTDQSGHDSSSSWLHVTPSHMPWGIPMANQPSIVRFTAELPEPDHKPGFLCGSMPMQCKRKMDADMGLPLSKQHITEEKMAAHMSQLHISSSYTSHQPVADQSDSSQEQQYKRLVLCEEIRQLQSEPILPSSLLSKLEKPTMALVLWQPPAGNVGEALRQAAMGSGRQNRQERDRERERMHQQQVAFNSDNNNSSGAVDLNTIAMPGFGQPAAPMDL